MADQKVTELPIKNQSAINLADYLFGIDAAEGYQMLISDLAKKIIEDFTGSTLGGSSQALKTIIDAINTKIGNTAMGTTATTITGAIKEHETDISTLNGKLPGKILFGSSNSDSVTFSSSFSSTPIVICSIQANSNDALETIINIKTRSTTGFTVKRRVLNGTTWTDSSASYYWIAIG